MSRSGYSEDCENVQLWRAAVRAAIRGKRGQALLRDMLAALDALPSKRLIPSALVRADGECCALGSVALARGTDTAKIDPYERDEVARAFNIAPALAAEIAYENDEAARGSGGFDASGRWARCPDETPEQRWVRMRAWVAKQIVEPKP